MKSEQHSCGGQQRFGGSASSAARSLCSHRSPCLALVLMLHKAPMMPAPLRGDLVPSLPPRALLGFGDFCWTPSVLAPKCSWPVPEPQVLILGEVKPQCPVLHVLRAAPHKAQPLSAGTLLLYSWHLLPSRPHL